MRISVFGIGYVGAVSCACLAELGHEVIGIDINPEKVDMLRRGISPIVEAEIGVIPALEQPSGTRGGGGVRYYSTQEFVL